MISGKPGRGGEREGALTVQWAALCRHNRPGHLDRWNMVFDHHSVACDVCKNRKQGEPLEIHQRPRGHYDGEEDAHSSWCSS